ncbi:hypothetical protein ACFZB5_33450 [Streptomyces nodosus]|uniref:hypothetical protein n=1 Tax=Streptomyces nodosus TaxID=40318 RepID=UPI0036EBDF8D
MHEVTTPVQGFTGTVAGVHFADGRAETDNETALAYFRRRGYGVKELPKRKAPAKPPESPKG